MTPDRLLRHEPHARDRRVLVDVEARAIRVESLVQYGRDTGTIDRFGLFENWFTSRMSLRR